MLYININVTVLFIYITVFKRHNSYKKLRAITCDGIVRKVICLLGVEGISRRMI
jgi:hypothetical protein